MRTALVVAGLLWGVSAFAGDLDHYKLTTAADLAKVCSTPASARDAVAATAFCHGVLAGSYGYFVATTPAADRFVCPPTPAVTRAHVAMAFSDWVKAHPQYENQGAIDALFRFAAEAYPCKR